MLDASPTPAPTDVTDDAPTPVVHLTRRARIEAERAAARAAAPAGTDDEFAAIVGAPVDAVAPASPVDLAPTSPVLPSPSAGAVTPPAPASPVVAPVSAPQAPARGVARAVDERRAGARVSRAADERRAPVGRVVRATARPTAPTTSTQGTSFRRATTRVTAVGALLFAAGLVVSTSLPAQALWVPGTDPATGRSTVTGGTQSLAVGDTAAVGNARDQYTVSDATTYANTDSSAFTNDASGSIQWPFLTGVPITSGFGGRQVAGCSFCSTNHMGVDFAPGEGTPIRVVADGVVTKVQANDGGYGNDVWVTHDVDGKQFDSVYGHMKDGTFKVVPGQHVEVGDELGEVGSTGNSTGPHLHLEIHVGGVPVDPLAWLRANAD